MTPDPSSTLQRHSPWPPEMSSSSLRCSDRRRAAPGRNVRDPACKAMPQGRKVRRKLGERCAISDHSDKHEMWEIQIEHRNFGRFSDSGEYPVNSRINSSIPKWTPLRKGIAHDPTRVVENFHVKEDDVG